MGIIEDLSVALQSAHKNCCLDKSKPQHCPDLSLFSNFDANLKEIELLANTLPFSTYMRSLASGRYLVANPPHAKQLGFEKPTDILPLPYSYLLKYRKQSITNLHGNLTLESAYQNCISAANKKVQQTNQPYRFQVCTLTPVGSICINVMQKVPISKTRHTPNYILTFSQDVTKRFDIQDLYALYTKHYPAKKQAIKQFTKYVGIDTWFSEPLTHRELLALLVLRKDARAKYVARELNLSNRTVEEYKSRLRAKIKTHISLEHLLIKLRNPFNLLDYQASLDRDE